MIQKFVLLLLVIIIIIVIVNIIIVILRPFSESPKWPYCYWCRFIVVDCFIIQLNYGHVSWTSELVLCIDNNNNNNLYYHCHYHICLMLYTKALEVLGLLGTMMPRPTTLLYCDRRGPTPPPLATKCLWILPLHHMCCFYHCSCQRFNTELIMRC